jgi:hypothetical protein
VYDLAKEEATFDNRPSGGAAQRSAPHLAVVDGAIFSACATTLRAHPHYPSPLMLDLNQGRN